MSAFEADRFNRSRTSPNYNPLPVASRQVAAVCSLRLPWASNRTRAVGGWFTCKTWLAAAPEEFPHNLGATTGHNPATNFDFVVQPWMIQNMQR